MGHPSAEKVGPMHYTGRLLLLQGGMGPALVITLVDFWHMMFYIFLNWPDFINYFLMFLGLVLDTLS